MTNTFVLVPFKAISALLMVEHNQRWDLVVRAVAAFR